MRHLNLVDETRLNALCYVDLNNRGTGKHTTKPCALGLLGHSEWLLGVFGEWNEHSKSITEAMHVSY